MSDKIVFWTSYSDNNINVFNKSLSNHQEYCDIYKYDLINFKEPYNKYIDVQRIIDLFKTYDIVITIGTDIIIKRKHDPIENYIDKSACITMCREFCSGRVLNGDFIIYIKSELTFKILNFIKENQYKYVDGQSILNDISNKKLTKIYNSQYLQIAAPIMNTKFNYSKIDLNMYLSFHYHNIGISSIPNIKYTFMEKDNI